MQLFTDFTSYTATNFAAGFQVSQPVSLVFLETSLRLYLVSESLSCSMEHSLIQSQLRRKFCSTKTDDTAKQTLNLDVNLSQNLFRKDGCL